MSKTSKATNNPDGSKPPALTLDQLTAVDAMMEGKDAFLGFRIPRDKIGADGLLFDEVPLGDFQNFRRIGTVVQLLQRIAGRAVLQIDPGGTLHVTIEDAKHSNEESITAMKVIAMQYKGSMPATPGHFKELLHDEDRHGRKGNGREVSRREIGKVVESELFPAILGSLLEVTGPVIGRGGSGADVVTALPHGGLDMHSGEEVQIKVLREDSPILKRGDQKSRVKLLKLATFLKSPAGDTGGVPVALIADGGCQPQQLDNLKADLIGLGVPAERIRIVDRELLAKHGFEIRKGQSDDDSPSLTIDLQSAVKCLWVREQIKIGAIERLFNAELTTRMGNNQSDSIASLMILDTLPAFHPELWLLKSSGLYDLCRFFLARAGKNYSLFQDDR